MIAWMVYAAVVGALVAAGGLALERLSAATGRPRRFGWLAALALAVLIPLAGSFRERQIRVEVAEILAAENGGAVVATERRRSIVPPLPLPASRESAVAAATVWSGASLVTLAVLCAVFLLVARARRRWTRQRIHDADVYVSRRFGPALVGVTTPVVVVPSWVLRLEDGARDAIIRHEVEHARARDHLALLFAGLILAAFPWSPAVWWMCRRLRAAVELDCDQRVIASGMIAADYGDVLLDAGSRSWGRWGLVPAMSQPKSLLERRLRTMSEKRRKLNAAQAVFLAGAATVALAVACDTPVPTDVREAFEEAVVVAREGEEAADLVRSPVLYVDGVRVDGTLYGGKSERSSLLTELADRIERVEIIKGKAAEQLYGEEASGGVIQIFTKQNGLSLTVDTLHTAWRLRNYSFPAGTLTNEARTEAIDRAEQLILTRTDLLRAPRTPPSR